MGSPLGPTFFSLHKVIWLNNCPYEFKPKIYRKKVDDTFLLFENVRQHQSEQYLNSQQVNIKFNSEIEIEMYRLYARQDVISLATKKQLVCVLQYFGKNSGAVTTVKISSC